MLWSLWLLKSCEPLMGWIAACCHLAQWAACRPPAASCVFAKGLEARTTLVRSRLIHKSIVLAI